MTVEEEEQEELQDLQEDRARLPESRSRRQRSIVCAEGGFKSQGRLRFEVSWVLPMIDSL